MNSLSYSILFALASTATVLSLSACSSSDDDDMPNTGTTDSGTNPGGSDTDSPPGGSSQPSPTIDLVPDTLVRTAVGDVYVDGEAKLTLYTRPADAPDTITCVDDCAATWPPLTTDVTATGISGQFDVIDRGDGTMQWMLKGSPLYFYNGDAAEGDINGQAMAEAWYVARPDPVTSGDTSLGETLVASGTLITVSGDPATRQDHDGRTLYSFDNDTTGVSNCNDACADMWPPLYADKGAADYDTLSIVTRADGTTQWAYDSRPLYLYSGDSVVGDVTGDGVNDLWHAVLQ